MMILVYIFYSWTKRITINLTTTLLKTKTLKESIYRRVKHKQIPLTIRQFIPKYMDTYPFIIINVQKIHNINRLRGKLPLWWSEGKLRYRYSPQEYYISKSITRKPHSTKSSTFVEHRIFLQRPNYAHIRKEKEISHYWLLVRTLKSSQKPQNKWSKFFSKR
jgi:hypothetical protein